MNATPDVTINSTVPSLDARIIMALWFTSLHNSILLPHSMAQSCVPSPLLCALGIVEQPIYSSHHWFIPMQPFIAELYGSQVTCLTPRH